MAKPTFAKLGLKSKNDIKTIQIGEQEIEIKQYLPIQKKLELISKVVNNSADDNNFANPVKVKVCFDLEVIYHYTNLSFTDKQKEDIAKTYDLLFENDIIKTVVENIPHREYYELQYDTMQCIESIYNYRNSVLGLMDIIKSDYNGVGADIEQLWEQLTDKENVSFLRDVMQKLG